MSSKSQIDIDLVISFMIFITFTAFVMNFILGLRAPITRANSMQIREKYAFITQMTISKEFYSKEEFVGTCNKIESLPFVNGTLSEYKILGMKLPAVDEDPDEEFDLLIKREENTIRVTAKCEEGKTMSLQFVFPKEAEVVVTNYNVEEEIKEDLDYYDNKLITVQLGKSGREDNFDDFAIDVKAVPSAFVTFAIEGAQKPFLGKLKIIDRCGEDMGGGEKFFVETYATLSAENQHYPIRLSLNGWWA